MVDALADQSANACVLAFEGFGTDIHEVWAPIAAADRFKGVATEDLLPLVCANTPMREMAEYL